MSMPNFFIIGAAKSGTSSLYHYVIQHPQVYGSKKKEPSFFAFEGRPSFNGPGDQEFNRSVVTDIDEYHSLFDGAAGETAIGEGSAVYLYSPQAPVRIHSYAPRARLIAILRNPFERAYSAFAHQRRDGYEPERDFHRALELEEERITQNWQHLWHYKNVGLYGAQLERYLNCFSREQILITAYEEFVLQPDKVLRDVFSHLGVDVDFRPDMSYRHNVSGTPRSRLVHDFLRRDGAVKSSIKPLIPSRLRLAVRRALFAANVRQQRSEAHFGPAYDYLYSTYRKDIDRLGQLLHRDFRYWLHPQ